MPNDILTQHTTFVDGVTSVDSKDNQSWFETLKKLDEQGVNIARLSTAAIGLGGESGEVEDIVKKVLFHGKPWTDELRANLIDEAGDVLWYWQNLCLALNVDPNDVMLRNIEKLESRYPGGKFSVTRSENRNEDN